jgi:chemotaxis protein CheX
MDVRYINPFINSTINTIEMMMGLTPEPKPPYTKENLTTQGDISGIIGFAEKNITGSVVLSFPDDTALKLYQALTGEEVFRITRDVEDSIGELTNIVAGGAKTVLASDGLTFNISIPSVIVGKNHTINSKVDAPILVVPFQLDKYRFVMEVSMKVDG